MRVFVTGGSGFLGSAVVRALTRDGHEVRAWVRPESRRADLEHLDVRVGELFDGEALASAMEGCEGLCHVAGAAGKFYADPNTYRRVNAEATGVVFAAAARAGVRRAVYTGTIVIPLGLDNAYARSKGEGWQAARAAAPSMVLSAVHPSGMIGPHDHRPTPLGGALLALRRGELSAILGGASGYIHVDDAARAHVAALERGDDGAEYRATAEYWKTKALFGAIAKRYGVRRPPAISPRLAGIVARRSERRARERGTTPLLTEFATSYMAQPRGAGWDGEPDRLALGLPRYVPVLQAADDAMAWFEARGFLASEPAS